MQLAEWKDAAITASYLRSILTYDEVTGSLHWLERDPSVKVNRAFNARRAGKIAGHVGLSGYIEIQFSNPKAMCYGHRVAWALKTGHWPKHQVDHRDGNRANNCWVNLRKASGAENCRNKKTPLGKVKFKGVTYEKGVAKYRARIGTDSGRKSLGLFDTALAAALAYDQASVTEHGPFSVTNRSLGLLPENAHA